MGTRRMCIGDEICAANQSCVNGADMGWSRGFALASRTNNGFLLLPRVLPDARSI